ncbi:hypothetical protein LTR70_000722 [Exophiala xenobiotica]|uniref:Heterokaryon incompatibility domain-containing protein n=1 Tax=Lithohypha guttulata TaxID=1690604 RepID=A0ABR0KNC6_9EURO|nr:hypothetical protein LTR24_000607 [Lithohypha guttulata]KAK5329225.1 hypothetical protein LTR70_000722 [Exophiala xenobiotica]
MTLDGAAPAFFNATTPYKGLEENEIRLLSILPGVEDDPLLCSLDHYNLQQDLTTHTAISYPWGPPEDPHHRCFIDGFEFTIRDNAFSILTRLRKSDEFVKVWIDCLCINQRDKLEKSAQIRLMHSIYKQAARTIIWLGKTDDLSDEAVDYIKSLDVDGISREFSKGWEDRWRLADKSFVLDILEGHSEKVKLFNSMARLFFAVYWSRVWIRQEAAVGGNLHVLWGRHELSWRHVAVIAWIFRPRSTFEWPEECWQGPSIQHAETAIETILSIDCYRYGRLPPAVRGSTDSAATPLFGQLVYSRSGMTTKAHDKIYALSSMSSDIYSWEQARTTFLKPDYSRSWQEVYVEAARFFFSKSHIAYQVLENAGMVYQGASSDLPSWCPDWRYPISTQIIASLEWSAGGNRGKVQTKITALNKKQRSQLLSHNGYASIMPLCRQLPRDRCKIAETEPYLQLEPKATLPSSLTCADPWCKDKISKAEHAYLQSASRAALVLEIQSCMQDKITYVGRRSGWDKESELAQYRQDILAIDASNLNFLEEQSTNRIDALYITDEPLRDAYNWTIIQSQDAASNVATQALVSTADSWRSWLANDDIDHISTRPPYHKAIESSFAFRDWCFAYTEAGYMCLVPPLTQVHDKVCIFNGYALPFVIRPTVQDWHILLGQCYVHGMMVGKTSELIDEFLIKVDEKSGKTTVKRPQGDVRANGLKMEAGRYVDILETLGTRWIKLI